LHKKGLAFQIALQPPLSSSSYLQTEGGRYTALQTLPYPLFQKTLSYS